MALNFPNSPSDGQVYTDTVTGNRWTWDNANTCWKSTSTFTQTITVASSAPGSPVAGQLWWNKDYGRLFVYYTDADTSQWVDASPSDGLGRLAYNNSNTAFGVANTALQNTNVTLAGNLTVTGNVIANKQVVVTYTPTTTVNAAITLAGANTQGGTGYADFLKASNLSGGTNPHKTFRLNSTGGIEVINSAYSANLLTVSNEGYVSKPYQPMCMVLHGATVSYGNGQLIQWSSSYDPLSMFSGASNYRITVPVAGRYLISVNLLLNSGQSNALSVQIRKNATSLLRIFAMSGYSYQNGATTLIVNCAANDYFDCVNESATSIYGADIGAFTIALVG